MQIYCENSHIPVTVPNSLLRWSGNEGKGGEGWGVSPILFSSPGDSKSHFLVPVSKSHSLNQKFRKTPRANNISSFP